MRMRSETIGKHQVLSGQLTIHADRNAHSSGYLAARRYHGAASGWRSFQAARRGRAARKSGSHRLTEWKEWKKLLVPKLLKRWSGLDLMLRAQLFVKMPHVQIEVLRLIERQYLFRRPIGIRW